MKVLYIALCVLVLIPRNASCAAALEILHQPDSSAFTLADGTGASPIVADKNDYALVRVAAQLFADDVQRVTGKRPALALRPTGPRAIIVGTLGHSTLIDKLAAKGKLKDLEKIKGGWESTLWQIVEHPYDGMDRALVIVGSDRRGAAYGLMSLSEHIGVSPWYWWADVPVKHQESLALRLTAPEQDAPAVKYRGIFINDEDWGIKPWAAQTFDPQFGNIGPKTYEKVFELMLRLRLNYIWPAMHGGSAPFDSTPDNMKLADRFGIVAGASHCEPMLYNNVRWNESTQGKWDYTLNRDAIRSHWENSAKSRGSYEAVWTLGIRGIHDQAMEGPPAIPTRINIVTQVIDDERSLLNRYVTKDWGPVAQCFVPYKEVLTIYDAGLKVPDDVTLVWVDDNFGYIRRLSAPEERKRSGGAGVYWHLSYYGGPHSYTWINTTAPALMWEELNKAWENEARRLWIINVGDIKPMEIGIDYFARLAWNPTNFGPDSQTTFLREFSRKNFDDSVSAAIADLLTEYYRLGTVRKPELMNRNWASALSTAEAAQLENDYRKLLDTEAALAGKLPKSMRDSFFETIGFPARVVGYSGLIFMADRKAQRGVNTEKNQREISRLRAELEAQVTRFNTTTAGGKWDKMMPGLVTGKNILAWNSQVRWPWAEAPGANKPAAPSTQSDDSELQSWRDAATADRQSAAGSARWTMISGLGSTGRAMSLQPSGLASQWETNDTTAPALEYNFETRAASKIFLIDFLPTFRIYPGMKMRLAIGLDDAAPLIVEVPGSNGEEDERGNLRKSAVQQNYTRLQVTFPQLSEGKHSLKIRAIDPGVVIDRLAVPL